MCGWTLARARGIGAGERARFARQAGRHADAARVAPGLLPGSFWFASLAFVRFFSARPRNTREDETATRHGTWDGAAVGALVGILFPPSIIGTALVGAAVGGVAGHLWRGMSRSDVKEFGEIIDQGQAALVIVGESKLEQAVDKADLKAEKHVAKELDVSSKDVDQAVQEAAREVS